jgi:hypothetical protein
MSVQDTGQYKYYRPYISDNESDQTSGSSSPSSSGTSTPSSSDSWNYTEDQISRTVGGPNFKDLASNLNKARLDLMAGPSTISQEISEVYTNFGNSLLPDSIKNDKKNINTIFNVEVTKNVSILTVDSLNRDKKVFPQPTYCVLRFPRVYKNVVSISFAEIKLLTSIFFFSKANGNTDITIYEKDRTYVDDDGKTQSTIIKSYIDDGSYNITDLASKLQRKLNNTPLFLDYTNGFNDFIISFIASGDLSLPFNEPGDYYYDPHTQTYIENPTKDVITSYFWQSRYANLESYSINNSLIAYYYPVINYYFINGLSGDINLQSGLGIDPTLLTTEDVYNRIIYDFQGLEDPVILSVINANRPFLDRYRLKNTFRQSLVNHYTVSINSQTQFITINSSGLNTSLSNLINVQRSKYLNQALSNLNINQGDLTNLTGSNTQISAVIQSMYSFYQTQFLNYFAVPWNQYSLSYYMNTNNLILTRNGENVINVPANTVESYNAGIITQSNSIIANKSTIAYWPTFSNINNTVAFTNLSNFTSSFNFVYSITKNNINSNQTFINSNNILYSQNLTGSATVVCPIQAGKYTVIRFISPVRQTFEVETLPRPIAYRIPEYNRSNYDSTINKYFNFPYVFSSNTLNQAIYDTLSPNNIIQIPGWSNNSTWGISYISSLAYYNYTANRLNIGNVNGSLFYKFITPTINPPLLNSSFTYSLNLSFSFYTTIDNISTVVNPPVNFKAFIYHDRAAFMGDIVGNKNRTENPYFYKYSLDILPTSSSNTIQITTYPGQTYYVTVRANEILGFPLSFVTVVPWFSSSIQITRQSLDITGLNPATDVFLSSFSTLVTTNFNYAKVYDSNWIQLPISKFASNTNTSSTLQLITSNLPMGHDTNGISTDFLDYIPYTVNAIEQGFNPSLNLALDPVNNYLFQSNSPFNGTYFYPGGNNTIMTPGTQQQYFHTDVVGRESKIIHYYSVTYLPESLLNAPYFNSNYITNTTGQLPYNLETTGGVPIPGYSYAGSESNIQLDRGVIGFSFIPDKGTWNLKRLMFRSAVSDSNNDPNRKIEYLGVYLLGDIINTESVNLKLSNALVVLSNSLRVTYTSTFSESTNGFDTKGGTYYEFIKDSSYSNVNLLGYSQTPRTMVTQPESIYVCVAFTSGGDVNTIKALSGSSIPYPYYNSVFTSTVYLDGSKSYVNSKGVVFPSSIGQTQWPSQNPESYMPTEDPTQSKYGNSYPIGTSVVIYKQYTNILVNNNFLKQWYIPEKPLTINVNVNGYMLLQGAQISIYPYTQYDITYKFVKATSVFTFDEIFNSSEFTSLEGISGNDNFYFFLGFVNRHSITTLRIKQFNPVTGEMLEVTLPRVTIPSSGIVKTFTVNNNNQLVFIYQESTGKTNFYYTKSDFTNTAMSSNSIPLLSTATHTMNAGSTTLFWLQQDVKNNMGRYIYEWDLSSNFPGRLWKASDSTQYWNQISMTTYVDIPDVRNRLFLTNTLSTTTNTINFTTEWIENTSTFNLDTINKPNFTIENIYSGYSGSLWVTDANNLTLWGNRNQQIDIPGKITPAWQIFYPFQRITLEKLDSTYDPMTDLTNINYPEYPHTNIFYYDNTLSYTKDILSSWGLEKNAAKSDSSFNGYYFNSQIAPFSINKSTNNIDFKYIVVRGFTPTENSEVLLRFVIPNKYTFGYITSSDIISELQTSNTTNYDIDYYRTLSNFNTAFNRDAIYGANTVPNFNGQNIITTGYSDFYNKLSTLYNQYNTTNNITKAINIYINSNISQYISSQLVAILPPTSINRQTFTSPLLYSILWSSSLLPQYKKLIDNWGLGFNLGFTKKDTPFSVLQSSSSFYKIIEGYLYLRLSPEHSINTLDVTKSEDLSISRESTGSIKEYYGKLLLGDFNTYSRTFISNQVSFNPPIAKLDKLSFEWIASTGLRLDNNDSEWSASLAIAEYGNTATIDSTVITQKIEQLGAATPVTPAPVAATPVAATPDAATPAK